MQQNILKDSSINKIYLTYVDAGARKKYTAKLRYMDTKVAYFAIPIPPNFSKPKKKTPIEIKVYSTDGIYIAKVMIVDTSMSMNEILFELTLPKTWDYTQMRNSLRKRCELPVNIKFNDGFSLSETTYDISLGGISFLKKEDIPNIYKEVSCILTLQLPKNTIINFPNGEMVVEAKCARTVENVPDHYDETLYVYKFLFINPEDKDVLKHYLIKLD